MHAKRTKNSKNAKKLQLRSDNDKDFEDWKSKLKRLIEWDRDKIFCTPVREIMEKKNLPHPVILI